MNSMRRVACAVVTVALVALTSNASALVFTCEGIVRKGTPDPAGAPFGGKFGKKRHGGPAINGSGDVVFFATPKGGPRRLYLYPNVGAPVIVAEEGQLAPGGGSFTAFRQPSINDAGDIAFFGDLASGEGVFVEPAAGAMFAVALAGDPAPGGGTFDRFDGVARINAAGDVAFLARVSGGANGIFLYDSGTATISSEARVGDLTLDGREICDFIAPAVGLGATSTAFHVSTKVSCVNALETALTGIYRTTGLGIDRVALQNDPTPIGGTTYANFFGDPDLNEIDEVLFRASITGTVGGVGLFLFDPVGPTTIKVAKTGDGAPLGGALRTITEPNLTNGGRAGFRANVKNTGAANQGIYLFDGVDEAVVRRGDPVPTNIFLPGSTYSKIFEEIGFDRSGTWVTYSANVKEPNSGTKIGLFRCEGM
jgi:hypothetical protein